MEISLSTHLFVYNPLDESVASLFPRFGFPSAEIWAMPPHFPFDDPGAADGIAGILASKGVRVASLHAPLYPDVRTCRKDRWYSLSSKEEEHRRSSVLATARAGKWLSRNGGGTMVLHTMFPAEDWYPARRTSFLSSMEELFSAVPENVVFAVENTPLASGRAEVIRDIVDRFPSGRAGICIDLGHGNLQEGAVEAVRAAGDRLIHVHASDNDGVRDDHLVPGRGTIAWDDVFTALGDAGFHGPFTVELRDYTRGKDPLYDGFDGILRECRDALSPHLEGGG